MKSAARAIDIVRAALLPFVIQPGETVTTPVAA